ncbi:transposase, partial [Castellaniella sp. GW247-6E4]|uniref:transposase n=1 Tax=Castellaniella sp. GW247-6E4 TaxID=3140380 RepID=UPI0033161C61
FLHYENRVDWAGKADSEIGLIRPSLVLKHSPARALAATLNSWPEPIVRMWRFSKSNGITEGFHTKMEMLSRRAYGFRNFENYRMRVLAQCGWNGVINRV